MIATNLSEEQKALADIWHAVRYPHLWLLLGWQDIKQRYRRSMLGPFWLTISTAFMVTALGLVYSRIFGQSVGEYLPYLAAGLVVWTFISGMVTDGCQAFIGSEGIIKQIRMPLFTHVLRVIWRNLIILGHNAVIVIAVSLIFGIRLSLLHLALFTLGLAATIVIGGWTTLIVGTISARFRDVPQIIANLLQMMFFLTPIIWHTSLLPGRQRVVRWNPLYHMMEVVRAPLLGNIPALETWVAVSVIALGGWLLALVLFCRYRKRIAYWL